MKRYLATAASAIIAFSSPAIEIDITNGDFESPTFVDGDFEWGLYPGGTVVGGWTTAGGVGFGAGITNPTTDIFSSEAPDGNNVGFVISFNTAWLIQTLTTTYVDGETYTLTALVGDGDLTDFSDYTIGLYVAGIEKSAMTLSPTPADDGFALASATVVADASMHGQAIEVRLGSFSSGFIDDPDGTDRAVYFDSVKLESTVPTPNSLMAILPGILIVMRRKHRHIS